MESVHLHSRNVCDQLLVTVVADCLDRATLEGFRALSDLLIRHGLLLNIGKTAIVTAHEKRRSRFAAEIAIDALLVHVKLASHIIGPFFSFVCHRCGHEKKNLSPLSMMPFTMRHFVVHLAGLYSEHRRLTSLPMGEFRSYLRNDYPRERTSALVWLISALVAGFFIQNILVRWLSADVAVHQYLLLSASNLREYRVWTLLTYSLFHDLDNLLHILFALLALYFTGRDLLTRISPQRFLALYAAMAIAGGLCWALVHWRSGGVLLGSSAAIYGLITLWVCFEPNRQISVLLLFIPVTLPKAKYLVYGLLFIDLCGFLFAEIIGKSSPLGIAHSAHLAGMAVAWVYFQFGENRNLRFTLPWRRSKPEVEAPHWAQKTPKVVSSNHYQVNLSNRDTLKAEVDRILDKINSQGFASLTPAEKRTLDEARDLLNKS